MKLYWWCFTCEAGGYGEQDEVTKASDRHVADTQHGTFTSIHPRPS